MKDINRIREQGYSLSKIYTFIRAKGVIDCTESNFRKYYYFYTKNPDTSRQNDQVESSSEAITPLKRIETDKTQIDNPSKRQRIGDDFSIEDSNRLSKRLFKSY